MSNIIHDFKSSVFSDESIGLAKDYAELALDHILDDGSSISLRAHSLAH